MGSAATQAAAGEGGPPVPGLRVPPAGFGAASGLGSARRRSRSQDRLAQVGVGFKPFFFSQQPNTGF